MCASVCASVGVCACVRGWVGGCVHMCVCTTCARAHVCVCVCACACMCVCTINKIIDM